MKPLSFNIQDTPIEGINLIEASAGTGKTFAIENIYLRLISEKKLRVDQILVVTFTEAATAELKNRIRNRLKKQVNCIAKHDQPWVSDAIRDFDEAAIFTIHGFCYRTLKDNAFESSSLFDTELVTAQEEIIREIIEDYWRQHVYKTNELFLHYFLRQTSIQKFYDILSRVLGVLDPIILPDRDSLIPYVGDHVLENGYTLFADIIKLWEKDRVVILNLLLDFPYFKFKRYSQEKINETAQELGRAFLNKTNPYIFMGNLISYFSYSELKRYTKKGQDPPSHSFFEKCDILNQIIQEIIACFDDKIIMMLLDVYDQIKIELPKRKKRLNIQHFDDLLTNFFTALESRSGKNLIQAVQKKYKAALIDEFQDTDPIQYRIFHTLFANELTLLFVGDPKQAIYSFRGADIFAYIEAKNQAPNHMTLDKNWRSEPQLINGINLLFQDHPSPFVNDLIPFYPATAADTALKESYDEMLINDQKEAPLRFIYVDSRQFEPVDLYHNRIKAESARELIYQAVAKEIKQLVVLGENKKAVLRRYVKTDSGKKVNDHPIVESDIAVLVLSNKHAYEMQKALQKQRIPNVLYKAGNLFDAFETVEMARLLSGIAEPLNDAQVKAALSTDIIGLNAADIDKLAKDEIEWENWLQKIGKYHEIWHQFGFMRMFKQLVIELRVMDRLILYPDGERRITNILHLAEVLHQKAHEKKLGMVELLAWLMEQLKPEKPSDEYMMRLESDDQAVKIITVHKSKGLEFPVVFCPFLWGAVPMDTVSQFHQEIEIEAGGATSYAFTIDLKSEAEHKKIAQQERLAEALRLAYVALTRARNRCYIFWGKINNAKNSSLTFLLNPPKDFNNMDNDALIHIIQDKCERSQGAIEWQDISSLIQTDTMLPGRGTKSCSNLRSLKFNRPYWDVFRITSFSNLTTHPAGSLHLSQHKDAPPPEKGSVYEFPKGIAAGDFFHDIFETLDFTKREIISDMVEEKLEVYGFDPGYHRAVCESIENVLSVQLKDGFSFGEIPKKQLIKEMGFYYPINSYDAPKIKDIFNTYFSTTVFGEMAPYLEQLHFKKLSGFMQGFIDLIVQHNNRFYIVDWKSNHLGNSIEDYHAAAILESMKTNLYIFQYCIYAVALHRFLKIKLPHYSFNNNFGGVYYCFVRGIDPQKSQLGIFNDPMSEKLVQALDEL